MNFFKRHFLLAVIFLTGAASLIIEVTATRILAPYFGNTLFTVSSVIGIILGGLSLGYYLGGTLADKHPKFTLFFFLILVAGVFTLLIQVLSTLILPLLGYTLGMRVGPVVNSLLLFLVPSVLLGMLSPFAVKLKSLQSEQIGKVSGSVFFWSTLGSIFGSFSAGFLFIPRFGIDKIIIGVSFVLMGIGLLGLWKFREEKFNFNKPFLFFILLLFVLSLSGLFPSECESALFKDDGVYTQIRIQNTKINGKKARVLLQDKLPEGAIFLNSDRLPFDYARYYRLYRLINSDLETALFLGGGAYSMPQKLLKEKNNVQRVDVAEIEPSLYPLAKEYFKLEESPKLSNHLVDGRRYLQKTDRNYDMIFGDVYGSLYSIPSHMTTQEFFNMVENKLSSDGFFVMNVIGSLDPQADSFLLSEVKTLKSVFEHSYLFAIDSPGSKEEVQNFIFVGLKNDSQAEKLEKEIREPSGKLELNLSQKLIEINKLNLKNAPVLTDNFAPVEYMTAEMIGIQE